MSHAAFSELCAQSQKIEMFEHKFFFSFILELPMSIFGIFIESVCADVVNKTNNFGMWSFRFGCWNCSQYRRHLQCRFLIINFIVGLVIEMYLIDSFCGVESYSKLFIKGPVSHRAAEIHEMTVKWLPGHFYNTFGKNPFYSTKL